MPVQDNQGESGYSWIALARPFKRKDREFYVTVFAIAAVVGLILFIAEGLMPVVLLVSLVFLYYIMNTVEPGKITHKITEKGIMFGDTLNEWDSLQRFWFGKRNDNDLLYLQTTQIPGKLEMVVNPEDVAKIRELLKKYLPEEEVPPTFLDKTTNWIGNKLPNK